MRATPGVIIACLLLLSCGTREPLRIRISESKLPADGFSRAIVETSSKSVLQIVEGEHSGRLERNILRAGIVPGTVVIEAVESGAPAVRVSIAITPFWNDRYGDGTPDFLRLDDAGDASTFVHNFVAIALKASDEKEVNDCSALLRFAYRGALREHEGRQISKYQFPWTPLGARVFLTGTGHAEFADADSLRRFNTHFISRDILQAEPGDLLFFRQPDQKSPFHAMIVASANRVVYHTGPIGANRGELRGPTIPELLRHELPKWRPLPGNGNFLGVYRWNILRQDS
ncbi:MAG: DUF1175 family protein [Bryobacteraceae bacterium]|nr:DUF1175 family protein [Bryobacteraceae bacterium]